MGGPMIWGFTLVDVFTALAAAAAFLALRFYPIWNNRMQGCDAYYILLCAESLRAAKRLPIRLPPLYLLEEQDQWYPPGFLVLCACLPPRWLSKNYWMLNHLLDLGHISIAYGMAAALGQPAVGALLILTYGMMPSLVREYASLNTRPLGMLLQSGFLVAVFMSGNYPAAAAAAAILGILLYYSHKLSLQQLWFTMPVIAALTQEWMWLAWLAALYGGALLIWPRGFLRILDAHWVIVRFWGRYWPFLGAHAVRQSPVYGDGKTRAEFYAPRAGSQLVAYTKEVLHQNYFIVPALALSVLKGTLESVDLFLVGWILSVYLAAYAIHFIKGLRSIGLGRQYVKFAILPTLLFLLFNLRTPSMVVWGLIAVAAALEIRQYWLVARSMRREATAQAGRISAELNDMLATLRPMSDVRLVCLPYHLSDLVAYSARVPVYWGTHGHIFDERLADFFPVVRRPLAELAKRDRLTHLLLDRQYVAPQELGLSDYDCIRSAGAYSLYRLRQETGNE